MKPETVEPVKSTSSHYAELVAVHFALEGETTAVGDTGWSNCYKRAVVLFQEWKNEVNRAAQATYRAEQAEKSLEMAERQIKNMEAANTEYREMVTAARVALKRP